jgi:hypothetical protein
MPILNGVIKLSFMGAVAYTTVNLGAAGVHPMAALGVGLLTAPVALVHAFTYVCTEILTTVEHIGSKRA